MIANQDIGFVVVGQEAEIKIDTFNFTRYGLLHGTVLTVSERRHPARPAAGQAARQAAAAEAGSSEPKGQELVYAARVSLDRNAHAGRGDKAVNLSPGMAVTVEIKTGSRSILSYLLSPLVRFKHDSLRER